MNIEIKILLSELLQMEAGEIYGFLKGKGLDLSKQLSSWDTDTHRVFEGTALPAQHSGYIKTCIGMVPIKKPWLEAVA